MLFHLGSIHRHLTKLIMLTYFQMLVSLKLLRKQCALYTKMVILSLAFGDASMWPGTGPESINYAKKIPINRHEKIICILTLLLRVKVINIPQVSISCRFTHTIYRSTWIWRTTVRQTFVYHGRYSWSQSDAYQVFVICIRRILHMTDQFSWSHWVCHIQFHL